MSEKVVLITGASSGIGKEAVLAFARSEVKVIAAARRTEVLAELEKEYPGYVVPVALDVSDIDSVNKLTKIIADYEVTALINNAGITSFRKADKDDLKDVKAVIDTNLLGAIYLTKAVLPDMIERNAGQIINVASVVVNKIFTNSSVYSASKAGLVAYMKVLREEVREHGITVTNVMPGATQTAIWSDDAIDQFGERMMTASDVAEVIFKIYTDNGSAVTEEIVLRPVLGDL